MCPRMMKKKMNVADPSVLIPELPSPNDLRPFPTQVGMDFKFHKSCVRSISITTCGNFLASGDEDHNLVIWHLSTGKILRKYKLQNKVIDCIEWCPSKTNCLIAVANEECVYVIQPQVYQKSQNDLLADKFEDWQKQYEVDAKASDQKEKFVKWKFEDDSCIGKKCIKMEFNNI